MLSSLPHYRNSRHDKLCSFLVYGEGKALAVRHILEDESNIDEYPAQLIKPVDGEVVWFLDTASAKELKGKD